MGLLDGLFGDSWEDPKSQAIMGLAQGLLSARGSQGLALGVGKMNEVMANAKEKALRERLLGMQVSNYESEIRARDLAAKKQEQLASMVENMFGGGPQFAQGQSALQGQADQGMPSGPTMQAAQAMQAMPRPGGIAGIPLDKIVQLKMAGGPDLLPAWKVAQEGFEEKPGGARRLPDGRLIIGPPTLPQGMSPEARPDGTYGARLAPGMLDATAALTGAQARATAGANAEFDLVEVPDGNGGKIQMPKSQAIQRLGGQAPGMSNMPSIGNRQPTSQEMTLIQRNLADYGVDPNDPRRPFVNFNSQPGQPQGQLGRTPSAAELELAKQQALAPGRVEEERQLATARADVVRDTGNQAEGKRYGQFGTAIDEAMSLLKKNPTASGMGAMVDSAANFFGRSTNGADVAAQLNTVSGWLTSNVPRMEGPQGEKDVVLYQLMAGNVGNEKLPVSQRLASAEVAKGLIAKYAQGGSTLAAEKPAASAASAPSATPPGGKTATLADIAATARASGKSTAEVTKRMKELGYNIIGAQP